MTKPAVEVADILRAKGSRFLDKYRSSFSFQQLKAFRAIRNCRTAALGGHLDACPKCGHRRPSPITHAETGTARSVRLRHANAGWSHARRNCCQPVTFTSCSVFPMS